MKSFLLAAALVIAGTTSGSAQDQCSNVYAACVNSCAGNNTCETNCQQMSNACYNRLYEKPQAQVAPLSSAPTPIAPRQEAPQASDLDLDHQPVLERLEDPKPR